MPSEMATRKRTNAFLFMSRLFHRWAVPAAALQSELVYSISCKHRETHQRMNTTRRSCMEVDNTEIKLNWIKFLGEHCARNVQRVCYKFAQFVTFYVLHLIFKRFPTFILQCFDDYDIDKVIIGFTRRRIVVSLY